jgi:hypothetical protein
MASAVAIDVLKSRIRSEYREMPGLNLTLAQACRLWQMDQSTCETVLGQLTTEGALVRLASGKYAAAALGTTVTARAHQSRGTAA